jgi:hypothetical protein
MGNQSRLGLANYIHQLNSTEKMCNKGFKHGWVIKSGQKYFTPNNEKGSRDQNFEAEEREKSSQVGPHERSENGSASETKTNTPYSARCQPSSLPENLAAWLRQTSREIGLSGPT